MANRRLARLPSAPARLARAGAGRPTAWWQRAVGALALALLLGALPTAGRSQGACRFVLGFRALHDQIPAIVGECLEDERHSPENGDALQRTVGGLLVWRKADNSTAFTDGYRTWVAGPDGLRERLNTERFPWEADPRPAGPALDAVFLGDSHFGFWDAAAALAPARVVNRGIPGQTSAEILARFADDVAPARPRLVFVVAGANDALRRLPPSATTDSLGRLLDLAREQRIPAYLLTVPPVRGGTQVGQDSLWDVNRRIGEIDDWIRLVAPARGATVVDLYQAVVDDRGELAFAYAQPDGIHLSAAGYARLTALIRPLLGLAEAGPPAGAQG